MQSVNRITLLGFLGADAELRYTPSGKAVCNFRLATSLEWKTKDGGKQKRTDWHSCTLWGNRAESLRHIMSKGAPLYVEGEQRHETYDDREGVKRYKSYVLVTEVKLIGSKEKATHADPEPAVKTSNGTDAPTFESMMDPEPERFVEDIPF